jgi:hypothetical protein
MLDMGTNEQKRFTLDDEPVDISEFIADNAESLEREDREEIDRAQVGDEIWFGGGAFAVFILRRVA